MTDLSNLESGGVQTQADPNSPMMKAWEQFAKSESFSNSKRWAADPAHVDGSMWNCFMIGWRSATGAERARCADLLNCAREGIVDTDLRSIRSCIEGGDTRESIEAERQ